MSTFPIRKLAIVLLPLALLAAVLHAQNLSAVLQPGALGIIQPGNNVFSTIPISATAGASTTATLTIPAPPPGLYNYICSLHFNASHDNSASTALTNQVTTSTNFNSYAIKFSLNNVANLNYDWVETGLPQPGSGCAKSTSPGTATTFVSPAGAANNQFAWTATYFQAP